MKTWLQLTRKCNQLQPKPKMAVCKLLKMVARDGIEPPTPAFSGPPTEFSQVVWNQRIQLMGKSLCRGRFRMA